MIIEGNNRKNILIFPCGSEIGLEIHNALKYSNHIELFGASSVSDHGKYVYANYIDNVPDVKDENFIEELNKVLEKNKIDFIFPAHDSVVLKLAENIEKLSCKVIGSKVETCKICRSKKTTYRYFKDIIRVPDVFSGDDIKLIFPLFLKPDVGQGSRGTYVANSEDDINFYLKKDPTLLVLEYLPGKEYTVDCFTNKDGELLYFGARERGRISSGISVNTFPIKNKEFDEIAKKINEKLSFRGAWFFQLKKNKDGELVLLEIAPRIAGSMALHRNLGVNFPLLSIFDAMGVGVAVSYNDYDIEMDRALHNCFKLGLNFKNVYIDLDDTIIFNNKLNPLVVTFLFQCINENIKVHLLSRHSARFGVNIKDVLKQYRLADTFDSIIDVKEGKCKSAYIVEKEAIFIDDSFAERMDVSEKLKIPVFEVSSLESLINWKQ